MHTYDRHAYTPTQELYFIDVDHGRGEARSRVTPHCPCLTRARAGSRGFWVTNRARLMTHREILAFQGVPEVWVKGKGVTDRQLRLMAGNAFSLNVASRVLLNVLRCVDFVLTRVRTCLSDPWGDSVGGGGAC
jgi:hypothetical protein